jgi:MFS transporter, FHS family, L-fucose permease
MLIFAACLAVFVYGMVASMLGTINPALAASLHLTNVQTGYIALSQGVGLVIASVSVGPLLDRKGKKIGLLLGLGLVAAALFMLANAASYSMMLLTMLILGVGGGITLTAANAMGSDVSEVRRAIVLNFLNMFVGLGGLATPFVAGNLLSGSAIRVAYGAAILTSLTFLIQLMTRVPAPVRCEEKRKPSGIFKSPQLYMLAFAVLLYTACEFAVWNWLPKYLMAMGLPESRALNILALGFALGLLLGRVAVAPVLIRVAPLTVTIGAAGLMAATTFAMLRVVDPLWSGIIVFCVGLAMAPVFPTTVALVGGLFKQGTATAIGFTITCGFTGLVVSSPIIGWLAGPDPQGLGAGLLILPICSIIMAGIYATLRIKMTAVELVKPTIRS